MRILFAGTPSIAVPSLRALSRTHDVVGVLTNPDTVTPKGTKVSEVKAEALSLGLPVLQPQKLDQAARDGVAALNPDILVCVAFGLIFGPKFLGLFPEGGLNLHPSLLPELRGPAPIQAAILRGLSESGISVQRLALKMDAGDILLQSRFALDGTETTASLTESCAQAGAEMLVHTLAGLASGTISPRVQDEDRATYCGMIKKEDGRIEWTRSAVEIERMVRAYDPWPRAYTNFGDPALFLHGASVLDGDSDEEPGTVLRVDKTRGILIQTGKGLLAVHRLQLQAKRVLDFPAFLNGVRGFIGSKLGGQRLV